MMNAPDAPDGGNITIEFTDEIMDKADPRPNMVLLGADPEWLQEEEIPRCTHCRQPMRFIAQIEGEVECMWMGVPYDRKGVYLPFGDAGRGYLFICETECQEDSMKFLWQTT